MQLHVAIPNFGRGSTPEAIAEIAEEAEELGFDGIGTTDHILVPKGTRSATSTSSRPSPSWPTSPRGRVA